MFRKKYYLYLNYEEERILIHSLTRLKDLLIQQGRYTGCVDELIAKILKDPFKKTPE